MDCDRFSQPETAAAAGKSSFQARDLRLSRDAELVANWMGGDPFATALFNTLSIVFPRGEAFVIDSVKAYRDGLPPALAADVREFVRQELGHTREHIHFNRGLVARGYDIAPLEANVTRVLSRFRGGARHTRLCATICLEHLTAIIAADLIRNPARLAGTSGDELRLWLWHAIEEVEHKSVTYDVWNHAMRDRSGLWRWSRRCAQMLVLTAGFIGNRVYGQLHLLRNDGISGPRAWRGVARIMLGRGGMFRAIGGAWATFFKPGFNPRALDDAGVIALGERRLAEIDAQTAKDQDVTEAASPASVASERRAA